MTASHTARATLPLWTIIVPFVGLLALVGQFALGAHGWYAVVEAVVLIAAVFAAVHHAEVVAHRVGEPFGTLVLALAVTVIESGLILSIMWGNPTASAALARDTVFATVMIILNGILGLCLFLGGKRYVEQSFSVAGVNAALSTIVAIVVLTLVLPSYTTTVPGPEYSTLQLGFVAIVTLLLYGTFLFVQTVRHRDYFLPDNAGDEDAHVAPPPTRKALLSAALLMVALAAVVLLAKAISPVIETSIRAVGAPKAAVGVVIALIVLLPEAISAIRAAYKDRLQTSFNLALGSALATMGLTIPVVAGVSVLMNWRLILGIDMKSTVLLITSIFVAMISVAIGRTTILNGAVLMVLFVVYLFISVFP